MKHYLILSLTVCLALMSPQVRAAVVDSGVQNVAIPQNFGGVYLRLSDGTTTGTYPADWNTAPWLNPFFGGVGIGNNGLLRPIITGTDQIVNLASGTAIGSGSNFALGESCSSTHVGPAANQFQIGIAGYMGIRFQWPGGGPDYYGWVGVKVDNVSAGSIINWAYQNTPGASIQAGEVAAVPEPATLLAGLACAGVALLRRRRLG